MNPILEVQDLHKSYGKIQAVRGISFRIQTGEIFGMVGPNGAGKTTTIECIEGLRQPDQGDIHLFGQNSFEQARRIRQRIGIQLQESTLPPRLKVKEAMQLFSSFYSVTQPWQPLLSQLGLAKKQNAMVSKLSGGQKQRLHIALALLNQPEIIFLDELTTGLDPQARHAMWDLVRSIREHGQTVFLTTHFMEEAEQLCDRVCILDDGQIIALDSPENLIRAMDGQMRLIFSVDGDLDPAPIQAIPGVQRVETSGNRTVIYGKGERLVSRVVITLEDLGHPIRDFRTEQPSLEDVFLQLTGQELRN